MNKLGEYLRAERLRRSLGLGQLARLVGYRNISKGARCIACPEQTGTDKSDILANTFEALGLDGHRAAGRRGPPGAAPGMGALSRAILVSRKLLGSTSQCPCALSSA